mmetsp:Transcript_34427/g.101194  ORF Transcript_34427/g.101194 Transcript_34427/m.101194 type:complete len:144 (-) Transcript_34427:42-473(-)
MGFEKRAPLSASRVDENPGLPFVSWCIRWAGDQQRQRDLQEACFDKLPSPEQARAPVLLRSTSNTTTTNAKCPQCRGDLVDTTPPLPNRPLQSIMTGLAHIEMREPFPPVLMMPDAPPTHATGPGGIFGGIHLPAPAPTNVLP